MRRRMLPRVASLLQAAQRVASEYQDMERVRAAGITWFDGVVYLAPLSKSEGRRLGDEIKALAARYKLPAGHDMDVALVAPRGSGVLYARVGASSAESAAQILCSLMRRMLDGAGLTIDSARIEVGLAEEQRPESERGER